MNPNHYPPSPSYYRRHPNIDARDLVSPDYWTDSALVHLMRAGRKDGEPFADAITNAFICLALWFRSQSLPVPHYSDALDAAHKRLHRRPVLELLEIDAPFGPVDLGPFSLNATGTGNPQWITITRPPDVSDEDDTGHLHSVRADSPLEAVAKLAPWLLEQCLDAECELAALRARIAELEAAALTAVDRPVAPALDTPAVEWTDAELREWCTAKFGKPRLLRLRQYEDWDISGADDMVTLDIEGAPSGRNWAVPEYGEWKSATEAARILNATKPDPFAGLLEVSDDVALEAWLTSRYGEPVSDQLDCGVGSATIRRWRDADRNLVCATWFYGWQKWQVSTRGGNVDAREAARTLHRMLTGGKP